MRSYKSQLNSFCVNARRTLPLTRACRFRVCLGEKPRAVGPRVTVSPHYIPSMTKHARCEIARAWPS